MLILRDLYVIVNYIKYKVKLIIYIEKLYLKYDLFIKIFFKLRVYYIYVYVILFEIE